MQGDVRLLDDALRSPRNLLRARADPVLDGLVAEFERRERAAHAADWRAAATLAVARRKGLPRELPLTFPWCC